MKTKGAKKKVSDEAPFVEPPFINPGDAPKQDPVPPPSVDAVQDTAIHSLLKRIEKLESILGIRK